MSAVTTPAITAATAPSCRRAARNTTATVATAILAILAGIVTGGSFEIASYVLLGGLAGIVAVRRGDRIERFLVAGLAIAVTGGLTITTFSLLGTRDLTGVLQLWFASAGAGGGAAVAGPVADDDSDRRRWDGRAFVSGGRAGPRVSPA